MAWSSKLCLLQGFIMKRNGLLSSLAGYCLVGICVGSLLATAAETRTAEVKGIIGDAGTVSVTVAGQPAKVGQLVNAGELIVTGDKSVAELDLGANGPSLAVLANSSVTLDELTADLAGSAPIITTRISIKGGSAAGWVQKTSPQSVYTVTTPTSTAAIKGTKWKIYADGRVVVFAGCVGVTSSKGAKFDVCKGQFYDPATETVQAIPKGEYWPGFINLPEGEGGKFAPPGGFQPGQNTPTSPSGTHR